MKKNQKGFSLIELLIVVAIILIIAAIAVPNLLRSRMAANEASAAGAERSIGTANVAYSSTFNVGFAGVLSDLGPPAAAAPATSAAADLLDSVLSGTLPVDPTPVKSGYTFTYTPLVAAPTSTAPNGGFQVIAIPVASGSTGQSTFCNDQTNVVLKDTTGTNPGAPSATGGCIQSATLIPM